MGAPAWETFPCRQCGAAVFVGALDGFQFRLFDADPVATSSGYVPIATGPVRTRFVPAPSTASAATWRLHWPTCAGLSPHDRAFALRAVERGARPAADRSAI